MKTATWNEPGQPVPWLLETARRDGSYSAWVNCPARFVVGFGSGPTEDTAVRLALADARTRTAPAEALAHLEDAYRANRSPLAFLRRHVRAIV